MKKGVYKMKRILATYTLGEVDQVEPNFPCFLYQQMAYLSWRNKARENGLKIHEIHTK